MNQEPIPFRISMAVTTERKFRTSPLEGEEFENDLAEYNGILIPI